MTEFRGWPSTPRLFRDVVITEKIDGTNACVIVEEFPFGTHVDGVPETSRLVFGPDKMDRDGLPAVEYLVSAQSRKRLITPDNDNHGFARWVWDNATGLARTLEAGYHYGEWWGQGIQRRYGMTEKRFSLFNISRWADNGGLDAVDGLGHVPVLSYGPFSEWVVNDALARLESFGSFAAPGFKNPEGICVYHTAARQVFKVLIENDHLSKTEAGVK